jgi:hypothetical protein
VNAAGEESCTRWGEELDPLLAVDRQRALTLKKTGGRASVWPAAR